MLHRREIEEIRSEMDTKGSALIPLSLYFQHGYAKIELGLGKGKKLFEGQCALCHGQTAEGGRGPSLARPTLRRAPDNEALIKVIQNGVPGSEMEGAWQMTDREVRYAA